MMVFDSKNKNFINISLKFLVLELNIFNNTIICKM